VILVKEDEMGRACSAHGEKRHVYSVLVAKLGEERPPGKSRRRQERDCNMDLRE
jgi:hypothetical protein